ncbi:molybdenum cofactor biosynthesis F family protein [Burkholderia multivorans]|uniref:MoaF C-terminal domain-containing protein n=1 Tax=Burkholderia multivorans TaxID=87883 RepID=UPI000277C796|nr:MoaF C-terminal domain-containing protein [Burkholderia multivorans]AJY16699.1 molybdenum cofactor biosynthesis F family protein [Burkholderia multivorans ATCC BAA-247]AVR18829.1 molybdenum cofactor biosynthesis protein F [Burkholderia multivorans]EJO60128.1 molybdenum cofactor biosynthesis protein F [Burkholderia multivorans ATCC BAA-247]MBU9497950.1 molybdenum cofactor biosynthesis F family protein [Burkholderia multivorans]MCO1438287.1 molybdenum cofactor biosynthesis F family protein [B
MERQDPVFIQVGALADGFAPEANILAPVDTLAGRTLTLDTAGGESRVYAFEPGVLRWRDAASGDGGFEPCRVTRLRDGLLFVDYVDSRARATSISLVIDLDRGVWTSVVGTLPTEADTRVDAFTRVMLGRPLTGVDVAFRHGTIAGHAQPGPLHAPTRELIGKRAMYRYSPTECYEHIYLNEHFYAWQCLQGVESGLADVDRCHYFRIAEALYLFVWREKVVPTLGVVLIDLAQHKTDGKIFGYAQDDFGTLSNFPVGAHAQVLNETVHPLDGVQR